MWVDGRQESGSDSENRYGQKGRFTKECGEVIEPTGKVD